jgi:hypothetical protein
VLAQHLGDRAARGRWRCSPRRGAGEADADDLGDEHVDRLAEHDRLGLDAADAPADDAEAVDHGGVRVGADEAVRVEASELPVLFPDDLGEVLEVDLVDDAGRGRDDAEVGEGALAPLEELIALAVALELEARHEGDLDLTDSGRVVGGELLDVLLADDVAVEVAQAGLEEDADAVRDRAEISEGVEAVDGAPTEGGVDGVLGVEGVAVRGRHGRGGV